MAHDNYQNLFGIFLFFLMMRSEYYSLNDIYITMNWSIQTRIDAIEYLNSLNTVYRPMHMNITYNDNGY